jgi:hypothetical protein
MVVSLPFFAPSKDGWERRRLGGAFLKPAGETPAFPAAAIFV